MVLEEKIEERRRKMETPTLRSWQIALIVTVITLTVFAALSLAVIEAPLTEGVSAYNQVPWSLNFEFDSETLKETFLTPWTYQQ